MNGLRLLTGLFGGALGAALLWRAGRAWMADHPMLQRDNYAGRVVPVAGGMAIVLAAIGVQCVIALWRVLAIGARARLLISTVELPALALVAGFGFLGLLDDVLGTSNDRGFRGHIVAIRHGRLTTGAVKLLGGAAIAVVVIAPRSERIGWLLAGAGIVALSANLANLLDRAPGRLLKASVVAGLPLLVLARRWAAAAAIAPPLGAAWAMLPLDLRERTMLGDVGANVVGAALGYLAVSIAGQRTKLILLGALVLVNALAEFVSFSKVIDAVAPLRWLDRWGRVSG